MKILLLGSGGREHALAWKIAQSPKVEKLYIAPGNAGTTAVGENVNIKATDFEAISAFALKENIEMVVVGPEDPLVEGIYDYFQNRPELKTYRRYRSVRQRSTAGGQQGVCQRLHDASPTSRQPDIKVSQPKTSKKGWLSSKRWKPLTY